MHPFAHRMLARAVALEMMCCWGPRSAAATGAAATGSTGVLSSAAWLARRKFVALEHYPTSKILDLR